MSQSSGLSATGEAQAGAMDIAERQAVVVEVGLEAQWPGLVLAQMPCLRH